MKNKLIFITPMLVFVVLLTNSCKSTQDQSNPSKSEDVVTSEVDGKKANEYYLQFSTTPQTLDAGNEVNISFTPKLKGSENEAVPLETMHDHKIHLVLVSYDLSYYQHLHPEYNADGSYSIKTLVKNGGKYVLFADYMPAGGNNQIERFEMIANGNEREAKSYNKENLTAMVDGYKVELISENGKFVTNETTHIGAVISKNGKEINANDLETLMSAKGHMVMISADTKMYIHVHPEVEDNKLDLHAFFDNPGIYRAFFQFQTDGKIHLAEFVVNVEQGSSAKPKEEDGHHH